MAYTVVMEKGNVSQQGNLFNIKINCMINDGVSDVFEASILKKYNPNSSDLEAIKSEILKEFKEKWDRYVSEKQISDSAALTNAISDMQETANAYVNA